MLKLIRIINTDEMSIGAINAIKQGKKVVLQSKNTECYKDLLKLNPNAETLDELFEQAETFEALYQKGAEKIIDCDVFCYIGNSHTNGFITQLKGLCEYEFIGSANNFSKSIFEASTHFDVEDINTMCAKNLQNGYTDTAKPLLITDVDSKNTLEDVKLYLSDYYDDDLECVVINNSKGTLIKVEALDKCEVLDGLNIVLPKTDLKSKWCYTLQDILKIVEILRGEGGCPWDREQTHQSLRGNILEESYEVIEAIDNKDTYAMFDELGDVLLQVVFHAQIAKECHEGDILDITTAICQKMIHRHPHIFGDVIANTTTEVLTNWEAIKRQEKGQGSISADMREIAKSLGAMLRAEKIQKKAALSGFDFANYKDAYSKIKEEVLELEREIEAGNKEKIFEESGDLIFAIINVLRLLKLNPELALGSTCDKFISRFSVMEEKAEGKIAHMSINSMEKLWQEAKNTKK